MIIAVLLLSYAGLLSLVVPTVLSHATWTVRAPRLAIGLWQALSASWLASIALAGLTMTAPWLRYQVPTEPHYALLEGSLATLCAAVAALAGGVLAGGITIRAGYVLGRHVVRARWQQRSHAAGLALIGRTSPELGAVVVEQDVPAAYCVPNPDPRRRIVVTTAALRALSHDQLQAVLAHERAHVHGRHHISAVVADGLARAFPAVPLFNQAREQIAMLAEMSADDAAARQYGRPATAGALLNLARASLPAAGLAAGTVAVVQRIERLLIPPAPLTMPQRAAGAAAAVGAFVPPVLALLGACMPLAYLVVLAARLLPI